jgi:hypothetical protein
MKYDHRLCEDEDDAARMLETILRELGYDPKRGANRRDVTDVLSTEAAINIARCAERIARWARTDAARKPR